jgi:hypothetical protein
LKKHRVGEFITSVPCLYDAKYEGMASEEIYDILYENAEKIDIGQLIDKMLDEHLDGEGNGEGGDKDGDGKEKGKGRPKLSAEERQQIKDEIKEAVLAAAAASDGAGNLPAGVKRIIEDMTAPKMNWRELLRMQLESTIKSDYTWMRNSRRGWHMDAVMPGMKLDPMIDIAVTIDASGSMLDRMLKDFLAEDKKLFTADFQFPIMVLRHSAIEHNIQRMASYCKSLGFELAPHVKTPMAPKIAKRQIDAGAWGLTIANFNQAAIMFAAGFTRLIIGNEVMEPTSIVEIAKINGSGSGEIIFYIDSIAGLEIAKKAIEKTPNAKLNVFMEIGAPGGRAGIRDLDLLKNILNKLD